MSKAMINIQQNNENEVENHNNNYIYICASVSVGVILGIAGLTTWLVITYATSDDEPSATQAPCIPEEIHVALGGFSQCNFTTDCNGIARHIDTEIVTCKFRLGEIEHNATKDSGISWNFFSGFGHLLGIAWRTGHCVNTIPQNTTYPFQCLQNHNTSACVPVDDSDQCVPYNRVGITEASTRLFNTPTNIFLLNEHNHMRCDAKSLIWLYDSDLLRHPGGCSTAYALERGGLTQFLADAECDFFC